MLYIKVRNFFETFFCFKTSNYIEAETILETEIKITSAGIVVIFCCRRDKGEAYGYLLPD